MQQTLTINGVKVFPVKYLLETELTESDIEVLLNNESLSLKYSIILGMFEFMHIYINKNKFVQILKTRGWMNQYEWTYRDCQIYEDKITKIIKKLYYYSEIKARSIAQWYIIMYGFKVKGNKIDF